jgi:hypothetical protein
VLGVALGIGFGVVVLISMAGVAHDRAGTGGVIGIFVGLGVTIVGGLVLKKCAAAARAQEEQRRLQAVLEEQARQAGERLLALSERFGQPNARRIVDKTLWQGATEGMIREMLGAPEDVSRKVYKTKTTETWKYGREGRSYHLQITMENGVCVGWKTS